MMPADDRGSREGIARGLTTLLELALAPGSSSAELHAARDAAQRLGLGGLDRVLDALDTHVGRPWPAELKPVIERLLRGAARCAGDGDVAVFRAVDRELEALAAELNAIEWSAAPETPGLAPASVPTLAVHDVLGDLPLAGDAAEALARGVRLTTPVAAALRAALDWISGEGGPRRPLALGADEAMFEVECEALDPAGLGPAHEVLAAVDGHLGPAFSADLVPGFARRWMVRVPAWSAHPQYLMLEQGELKLAVPWHAVLRLRLVAREELEMRGAPLGLPTLEPLVPLTRAGADVPIVLIGHGLKRAWLIADRLVWRLAGRPSELEPPIRARGLTHAVTIEGGEAYTVVSPGILLEHIALPPLPEMPRGTTRRPPVAPSPESAPMAAPATSPDPTPPTTADAPPAAHAVPAPASASIESAAPVASIAPPAAPVPARAAPAAPIAPPAAAPDAVEILSERWVTPRATPARPGPAPSARSESARPAGLEPAPSARSEPAVSTARRALVAEDSFAARVFLCRLLEQQGFAVSLVERAADLEPALAGGAWQLVCVDVELPDARGASLLESVRGRVPAGTPVIALVRDDQDEALAARAGIARSLRKPFGRESLERMLDRLGLGAGRAT